MRTGIGSRRSRRRDEDLKRLKESFPKPRDAVDYIMDTFPIVKRKDEAAYGSYRTKEMILQIYDEMQEAVRTRRGVSDEARVRSRGAGSVVIRNESVSSDSASRGGRRI